MQLSEARDANVKIGSSVGRSEAGEGYSCSARSNRGRFPLPGAWRGLVCPERDRDVPPPAPLRFALTTTPCGRLMEKRVFGTRDGVFPVAFLDNASHLTLFTCANI